MNLGSTMFLVLLSHHSLLYSMPKFKTKMNNKSTYSLFARLAKFMYVYFSLYYVLYADNFLLFISSMWNFYLNDNTMYNKQITTTNLESMCEFVPALVKVG